MILIPRYLKRRKTVHSKEYYHYELIEDKCTKNLATYRCKETGCIETWQKRDFETEKRGARDDT